MSSDFSMAPAHLLDRTALAASAESRPEAPAPVVPYVLAPPVQRCGGTVGACRARRARSVSLIKLTPCEERDLQRFEEARRDFAMKHSQLIFRALRRLFRRPDAIIAPAERGKT